MPARRDEVKSKRRTGGEVVAIWVSCIAGSGPARSLRSSGAGCQMWAGVRPDAADNSPHLTELSRSCLLKARVCGGWFRYLQWRALAGVTP
jgi:hypothetical protein